MQPAQIGICHKKLPFSGTELGVRVRSDNACIEAIIPLASEAEHVSVVESDFSLGLLNSGFSRFVTL